jgi:hypothetical protein
MPHPAKFFAKVSMPEINHQYGESCRAAFVAAMQRGKSKNGEDSAAGASRRRSSQRDTIQSQWFGRCGDLD